jgi:protein-disulfide isomerase
VSKQFLAIIAVIVLIFAGIMVFGSKDSNKSGSSSSGGAQASQHVKGAGTTGVTLVEYGDFQCPYCGQYFPIVEQVVSEYGDKIKFQFRNFPLQNAHPNAFAAARAAEAAGMQGKFFEMYSVLYQNQQQWAGASDPIPIFQLYAKQIGLNTTQFKQDYSSSKVNDTINADMAAGNKLNIQGTPTFFIDGKQVQVNQDVESFKKVLDAEITKKAPQTQASSQPAAQ